MTPSTSNIIAFPIIRTLPPVKVRTLPERVAEFTAAASSGEHDVLCDDHPVHVAAVVRASIRHARRKGARLDSLPPQLRTWLLDLCNQGDPTCCMIRDWLTGNRRFCARLSGEDA